MTETGATGAPPYHAQWESPELIAEFLSGRRSAATDPRWAESGARTPQEYEFWSSRTCGMACLRSILDHREGASPATVTLAHEVLLAGGYTMREGGVRGLVYRPFVDYLERRWAIRAEVAARLPAPELAAALAAGSWALASVHRSIRHHDEPGPGAPPQRGGHLVLAYGLSDGAVLFHNPSGHRPATRARVRLGLDAFAGYFAERAVLLPQFAPASRIGRLSPGRQA